MLNMDQSSKAIDYYLYNGAGNSFVMINNLMAIYSFLEEKSIVKKLCSELGNADGLIALKNEDDTDFEMDYYNADGGLGSMCGNGGRCAVRFAKDIGLIKSSTRFKAFDGIHSGVIEANGKVKISMSDVLTWQKHPLGYVINTGSPHIVIQVKDLDKVDVDTKGRSIRNSPEFKLDGINVNFIDQQDNLLHIRTYERGVERETLACGTGVTAAAIAWHEMNPGLFEKHLEVQAKGGLLAVDFVKKEDKYTNVYLSGPTEYTGGGTINL